MDFAGADYKVEVSALGYDKQTIPIQSRVNGWYIGGNLIFGAFLGWLIIDPATGGMWALDAANGQETESLKITLFENASEKMMSKANKIS